MDKNKTLISWLQHAYAMEKGLVEVLEAHRNQAEGYPDVQNKIREHLGVTKAHEEKVEACLRELGEEPAHAKGTWASFKANIEGAMTGMKDDRVVQNGMMDFSVEYYEIAVYTAIKTAAENTEQPSVVTMCESIIKDEQEMADWLEENLPLAVTKYMSQEEAEE